MRSGRFLLSVLALACCFPAQALAFPVATTVVNETNAAIAMHRGDERYLIVYEHEYSPTDMDVYGRFVDIDGISGPSFAIAQTSLNERLPDVEFNEDTGIFVVVWEQENIEGDREIWSQTVELGWDIGYPIGILIGGAQHLREPSAGRPRIASNSVNHEFFVVYELNTDSTMAIEGLRLDPMGGVIPGSRFLVAHDEEVDSIHPAISFNRADQYLVAWEQVYYGYHTVVALRLDIGGGHIGPLVGVCDIPGNQRHPEVAANALTHNYMVVWEVENLESMDIDIAYNTVDHLTGISPSASWVAVFPDEMDRNPDVIYNEIHDQFLVAWDHEERAQIDVYGHRYDGGSGPLGGPFNITATPTTNESNPVVGAHIFDEEYMLVHEYEYSSTDIDLYGGHVAP